jgi:hypothetical protein
MLTLLSKEGIYSKVIFEQWNKAIAKTGYVANSEYIEKYHHVIESSKESIQLTKDQEEYFLKWCINEIGHRIDAIVSNQQRANYDQVAGLLVATAETMANRGQKQEGMDLIEKYMGKYPRHRAFKSEVT